MCREVVELEHDEVNVLAMMSMNELVQWQRRARQRRAHPVSATHTLTSTWECDYSRSTRIKCFSPHLNLSHEVLLDGKLSVVLLVGQVRAQTRQLRGEFVHFLQAQIRKMQLGQANSDILYAPRYKVRNRAWYWQATQGFYHSFWKTKQNFALWIWKVQNFPDAMTYRAHP